ncbi:MAG TPA: nucleotidyl transferase AbiEii/AbiGii toxin family protein [Vicinamibacteria bacterium]|nr:nucleotidyl transferase AbiEii/AbiGii toxin family protein [Vicinamibacteria bacterium]
MALTPFQRDVCRLLAGNRLRSGDSYVAGGVALNTLLRAPRLSRDIDLFHDTEQALAASWAADRDSLERAGYALRVIRERPTFVEAEVRREEHAVLIQWAHDSAYRFFPLVEHEELGLVLHPFDLATGKVLALVGRVEPRDFVDTLTCHREVQPLGYLAWAACGKDPGFSPAAIVELAARSARYSGEELRALAFESDEPPDERQLSQQWKVALAGAREVIDLLPAEESGRAVLTLDGLPYAGSATELREAIARGELQYHSGRIRGAFPRIAGEPRPGD